MNLKEAIIVLKEKGFIVEAYDQITANRKNKNKSELAYFGKFTEIFVDI